MVAFEKDYSQKLKDTLIIDNMDFYRENPVPFVYNLTTALNNKCRIDAIYFDYARAFDTVLNDVIFQKQTFYKLDGLMLLRFLTSYLEGYEQQVVIEIV